MKKFLSGRTGGVVAGMAMVAGLTVGVGSSAAAAGTSSIDGRPCGFGEIGRELFKVDSAVVTPVVTHFTSFFVTKGTLSENTYNLNVVNYANTSINGREDSSQSLFGLVSQSVGFSVQRDRATTNTEEKSVKWTFNEAGHYGLYKGTRRVTGTFSRATCGLGLGLPRYSYRGSGTYTTFGYIEQGTVRCGDRLPAATVRRSAQAMLGCPAPRPAPVKKPATKKPAAATGKAR